MQKIRDPNGNFRATGVLAFLVGSDLQGDHGDIIPLECGNNLRGFEQNDIVTNKGITEDSAQSFIYKNKDYFHGCKKELRIF